MAYTSRQSLILGIHWSLFIIATAVLSARFYVRTRLRPGTLGWDDWTMLLAYGLSIGAGIVETLLVEYGIGKHLNDVNPANLPMLSKLTLTNSVINLLGTMMVKVSICLFLLRMTHRASRTVKWLVVANLTILIPFTIAVIIVDLVQCVPLKGYWDHSVHAKCINTDIIDALLKAASAVGVATDFFTAAIPIVIIYRVQIPRQQKWAVYAILMIGFFTAGASIAKTVVINWTPKDYTWGNSPVGYWGAIEHELGIIAGCLVTLRPLLQTMHLHFGSGTQSASSESHKMVTKAAYSRKPTISEDELLRVEPSAQTMGLQIQKMTEVEVSHAAQLPTNSLSAPGREDAWV
ncbi:hypothetical protein N7486_005306 [Penicillium sp. IBT 16267x]|nr:hypothetical protein N7486_005306 [Penicillium sp. IBT 16267x]